MTAKRKNKGGRPRLFNVDQIVKLHNEGLNNCEVARKVGCSPGYVSNVLTKRGIRTGKGLGANPHSQPNAQLVLDHIIANGGTLRNALIALDLKVCDVTVRELAKKQGIEIAQYRYFKQQKRNWLVHKPGFRKNDKAHNQMPVRCTQCGFETELSYQAFRNSNPCKCPSCSAH